MTTEEMAFRIFLKRMPSEPLNDANRAGFASKMAEAFDLAVGFEQAAKAWSEMGVLLDNTVDDA